MRKIIHVEALMEKVRNSEPGTKAKAIAWVDYMRQAEKGLPRQKGVDRRVFPDMMRRHLKWPLSMAVMVNTPQGYLRGTISSHLREYPHSCWVDFSPVLVNYDGCGERYAAIVPFRSMKPVKEPK